MTSPVHRAVQTAEELSRLLGHDQQVELCERLAPGQSSKRLAKRLLKLGGRAFCLSVTSLT